MMERLLLIVCIIALMIFSCIILVDYRANPIVYDLSRYEITDYDDNSQGYAYHSFDSTWENVYGAINLKAKRLGL
jgi:hypothetical protein